MSLQDEILSMIPSTGIKPLALYGALNRHDKEAVDTGVAALMRAGKVSRELGVYQLVNREKIGTRTPEAAAPIVVVRGDKNLNAVRSVLFGTLEGLRDGTMQSDRAKAIAAVSMTILKSVEVQIAVTRELRAADTGTDLLEAVGEMGLVPSEVK